jgi:hypothetical protein
MTKKLISAAKLGNVIALKKLIKRANFANVEAQYNLGGMYKSGEGVDIDYQKSLFWYSVAAINGSTEAKNHLSMMYETGELVKDDYLEQWTRY